MSAESRSNGAGAGRLAARGEERTREKLTYWAYRAPDGRSVRCPAAW